MITNYMRKGYGKVTSRGFYLKEIITHVNRQFVSNGSKKLH